VPPSLRMTLRKIRDNVSRGEDELASLDSKGVLRICGCISVPIVGDWVHIILEEAHCSKYYIYLEAVKMYHHFETTPLEIWYEER